MRPRAITGGVSHQVTYAAEFTSAWRQQGREHRCCRYLPGVLDALTQKPGRTGNKDAGHGRLVTTGDDFGIKCIPRQRPFNDGFVAILLAKLRDRHTMTEQRSQNRSRRRAHDHVHVGRRKSVTLLHGMQGAYRPGATQHTAATEDEATSHGHARS